MMWLAADWQTNYSVNKYEANFEHTDDPSDGAHGSKRALPATLAHLADCGHDVASLQVLHRARPPRSTCR